MGFNIGDRVRIKQSLEGGEYYGEVYFNSMMEELRGKPATVFRIYRNSDTPGLIRYKLMNTSHVSDWDFSEEMLEPLGKILFDIDEAQANRVAIHCPEKWMGEHLFSILFQENCKLAGNLEYSDDRLLYTYEEHEEDSCFSISRKEGRRGSVGGFISGDYTIMEYTDYDWDSKFLYFDESEEMNSFFNDMK